MSKETLPASFIAEPKAQEESVYVTIPEKDVLGHPHPNISLNYDTWSPGTHKVTKAQAVYIEDRLRAYREETIRLMQPTQHQKSLAQTPKIAGASAIKM